MDDEFGLSEGKTSDEKGVGISSYLGDSHVDQNTFQSCSSRPTIWRTILSDFMNGKEDTSWKESSLIAGVVLAS